MKLQLALDCRDLEEMRSKLEAAANFVDIIEVGTPLIMSEGMEAVREVRRSCPNQTILADIKIMDAGKFEAEMACDAGADIVTAMGAAGDATLKEAIQATHQRGKLLAVDMLGVKELHVRCRTVDQLGADIIYLHTSFDETASIAPPCEELKEVQKLSLRAKIAATGGVTLESVDTLVALRPEIIVVGRAITTADDCAGAAKTFHERIAST